MKPNTWRYLQKLYIDYSILIYIVAPYMNKHNVLTNIYNLKLIFKANYLQLNLRSSKFNYLRRTRTINFRNRIDFAMYVNQSGTMDKTSYFTCIKHYRKPKLRRNNPKNLQNNILSELDANTISQNLVTSSAAKGPSL